MKINKLLCSIILGIGSFIGLSFADCYIYGSDNELLMMYECEPGTTTEITLEGNWLMSGNTYTFQDGFAGLDIIYVDGYGKNQTLTTQNDVYLNGNLSIGYTGEQYLSLTDESCGIFDGYKTFFDVTGTTQPQDTEYNMFNNFADNSLKVLLSNIPGYIQYAFIFMFLLFLLSILKLFKKRK